MDIHVQLVTKVGSIYQEQWYLYLKKKLNLVAMLVIEILLIGFAELMCCL